MHFALIVILGPHLLPFELLNHILSVNQDDVMKDTLRCQIRTAWSLLGLAASYTCDFFIWMDFFTFYPCGFYLDGFF